MILRLFIPTKFIGKTELVPHRTMSNELAKYITTYFTDLLTDKEKLGLKHLRSEYKIEQSSNADDIDRRVRMYKRVGWLTEDKDVLELVSGGQDKLDRKIAERILSDHGDKVFINNCPNCGRLSRTPSARECRHCRHGWR
jgi:hypothetical protein